MSLSPGSRLGPYEILGLLGSGGMGEVYRARDTRLGREVAVKVLPAEFSANADRLRRFEQEARAASALNHPNILTIHDLGSHDEVPYIVSELLEGETLRERLTAGAIPHRRAVDYAIQVADGLAAAHEKGIVHRDLKPENLFVTKDGHVKILDFGLAKLTQPEVPGAPLTEAPTQTAGTEPGVVMGTVGYMSPEQVRGRPADNRSDIFSFGTVLYEMLSGKRAFSGASAADTLSAILTKEPPELSETNREVRPRIERIVRHCLEKNPEERFRSAHDLAFDLRAVQGESRASPSRSAVLWSGAALAFIVLAAGVFLWQRGQREGAGPRASTSGRKSIAVLPFQNLSPDPENAFFADGITEDILTQLAKIRDLKVISRTSVMRYKGTQKPVREIAAELGVATVLEGSVRRAGNRVRIVGQLIEAKTDEHLWAETYDRDLQDVFAIQSEVAQRIAAALQARLSPVEKKRIEERPTENLAAYDHYLRGREHYYRYRKEDNETGIEHFQKAVALDPGFALAYAGLGDAYAQRVNFFGFPESWLDSSLEASRKAISLDAELPDGYKALGLAYDTKGFNREALEANRRAVELNPNHAGAVNNLGVNLFNLGKFDEALRWLRRAYELDPTWAFGASNMGRIHDALGDSRRAETWFKRAVALQPTQWQAQFSLTSFYLRHRRDREALEQARKALGAIPGDDAARIAAGVAELLAGDRAHARKLFEQLLPSLRGDRKFWLTGAGVETYLAHLYLRAGRHQEAKTLLAESLATDRRLLKAGNQDWTIPFDMACVHALRDDKDEAFRWLERAVEAGWRGFPIGVRTPLLDSLRSDERLGRIEARVEALVAEMRRRAGLG